jgi:hypothetical protein
MSPFWKSMAQVAQGQLFIGGHLSAAIVSDMAKRANAGKDTRTDSCRDRLPWPRLAIPH